MGRREERKGGESPSEPAGPGAAPETSPPNRRTVAKRQGRPPEPRFLHLKMPITTPPFQADLRIRNNVLRFSPHGHCSGGFNYHY